MIEQWLNIIWNDFVAIFGSNAIVLSIFLFFLFAIPVAMKVNNIIASVLVILVGIIGVISLGIFNTALGFVIVISLLFMLWTILKNFVQLA